MYVCPYVFVLALCIFHNEREKDTERKMEKEGLACMMTQITETG